MTALIRYEAACAALAECKAVDEVKSWADKAAAMQAYGQMAKDRTLEVDAAEIRIRAERRLGELIAARKAGSGLNTGSRGQLAGKTEEGLAVLSGNRQTDTPTLAQAGIDKKLSSRAQRLAAVPTEQFEAELAAKRERDRQDGARVSARLEATGERELTKRGKGTMPEPPSPMGDDDTEADLLCDLQAEVERLTALIKAAEADDLKAETIKWRRLYEDAVRKQAEAMDAVKRAERREAWIKKQLMRCGRAVDETDPDKIAAAVQAFVRANGRATA